MNKICIKCGQSKTSSEYYKDSRGKDGLFAKCKRCYLDSRKSYNKIYQEKWNKSNIDKNRIYKLNSYHKHKESAIEWRRINKEKINEYHKKWRSSDNNKKKIVAHKLANSRAEELKKGYCESCARDNLRLEMHHFDYDQPFEVVTLCRYCHIRAHKLEEFE